VVFFLIFFLPKFAQGRNNKHTTPAALSLALFGVFSSPICESFFLTHTPLKALFSPHLFSTFDERGHNEVPALNFIYLFIYNVQKIN